MAHRDPSAGSGADDGASSAVNQIPKWSRSGSATPSSLLITVIGNGKAKPLTRSTTASPRAWRLPSSPGYSGVYLLDKFGDEPGGAGRTVGLDVEVADGLADQFSDFGGDQVGFGGCVVHAMAGAVAG